jgi:predicted tellurium resistance membrane protein TerC
LATLLLAALVVVETSDILFAMDSLHAVLSVT